MEQFNLNQTEINKKKNNPGKIIGVVVAIAIVVIIIGIVFGVSKKDEWLSYDNYCKIENGMTYSQVVDILDGHEGELTTSGGYGDYSLSYYSWSNDSGDKIIVIGFENGRVCAKSQVGLN